MAFSVSWLAPAILCLATTAGPESKQFFKVFLYVYSLTNFNVGSDFVTNLEYVIQVLEPIDKRLIKFQSDDCPLSEVIPEFAAMKVDYTKQFESKQLSKANYDTIISTLKDRFDFLQHPAHRMACLLDPRYFGQPLSTDMHKAAERDVLLWCGEMEETATYAELSQFLSTCSKEESTKSWEYRQLIAGARTSAQFWDITNEYPLLKVLARRLFSLLTSSASSKR